MPSSKDPVINRQKAKEYRLAHPEWKRRTGREWMRKKRAQMRPEERAAERVRQKSRDPIEFVRPVSPQLSLFKRVGW